MIDSAVILLTGSMQATAEALVATAIGVAGALGTAVLVETMVFRGAIARMLHRSLEQALPQHAVPGALAATPPSVALRVSGDGQVARRTPIVVATRPANAPLPAVNPGTVDGALLAARAQMPPQRAQGPTV